MRRLIYCFCILILFLSFGSHSNMLNFLKPYSYKICPKINGVINKAGEPFPGLELNLHVEYGDSYFLHKATTDKKGRFHFDEIIIHRWLKPSELNNNVIGIELFVTSDGREKYMWASYVDALVLDQFIIENLASLECDLDSARYQYDFPNEKENSVPYNVYGICSLKGYVGKVINEDED